MKSNRLYQLSVVRSVLFYLMMFVLGIAFPLLVCLALAIFIHRFYREEILAFFADRGRSKGQDIRTDHFAGKGLRFELVPPGESFAQVEDPASRSTS
jgi:hypothetical protein